MLRQAHERARTGCSRRSTGEACTGSNHGLIQERKIGINPETGKEYEPVEFEVSGDKIEAVHMIPGWTHNIINLSETENLVTVMTCNEIFDPNRPDTFFEKV